MTELVLFVLFGALAVGGALGMVFSRRPVYSALGLMLTLLSLAVFYVVHLAHFVAAVQVIVYAGAIMTLFLFVIMMIGVERADTTTERLRFQRPLVIVLGGVFLVGVLLAGRLAWVTAPRRGPEAQGSVENIADLLFGRYVLPFEVTSLLLIIAAVGAIGLGYFRPEEREADE